MKIVILGATGDTGKPLLRQTLEKGHTVTAILRDPSKLTTAEPNLTTIKVSCMLLVQEEHCKKIEMLILRFRFSDPNEVDKAIYLKF